MSMDWSNEKFLINYNKLKKSIKNKVQIKIIISALKYLFKIFTDKIFYDLLHQLILVRTYVDWFDLL